MRPINRCHPHSVSWLHILKIELFCKRAIQTQGSFAEETQTLMKPINRCHSSSVSWLYILKIYMKMTPLQTYTNRVCCKKSFVCCKECCVCTNALHLSNTTMCGRGSFYKVNDSFHHIQGFFYLITDTCIYIYIHVCIYMYICIYLHPYVYAYLAFVKHGNARKRLL